MPETPKPISRKYPATPDGRYFIVRGRLWRTSNPALAPEVRQALVDRLMEARRSVGSAKKAGDAEAGRRARAAVDSAKRALGERGPAWWKDGAPDYNRRMVSNTPYAQWFASLHPEDDPDAADDAEAPAASPGKPHPRSAPHRR